jgi:UDP-2,3-diacylglucosamine pyrophosphatase LpxH
MHVPESAEDNQTVLVLAGDVGVAKKPHTYVSFIEEMSSRFKHVIYVMGNHEYWKGNFPTTHAKIWNALLDFDNVDVLEKESVTIDGVSFICATLWTDMNKFDPLCMETCRSEMNDYNKIRTGPISTPWKRSLTPSDTVGDHLNAKHYLVEEIKKQKEYGNSVVVVTHHSPCSLSVPDEFKADIVNGAYYTDLSNEILDYEPDVWCHGHFHNSSDYIVGQTRVICNPRGYDMKGGADLNTDFDPELTVTVY